MSNRITIICGLARSGKSTYCQKYDYNYPMTVVINSDQVRLALHNQRYNRAAEPFVHACTKVMVKALYAQGYNCVIDETNTTIGSIRQWLEIDPDAEFVFIDTSADECERRAIACNQVDLVDNGVIRHMYENLQKLQYYSYVVWNDLSGKELFGDLSWSDYQVTTHRLNCSIEMTRQEVKTPTKIKRSP